MITSFRQGPETERLEHRAFQVSDADVFFALNSNAEVMRFTGEASLASVDAARHAIANYPDFDTVGYGRWACVLKDSRTIVGFCGLKFLPDRHEVDVGYRFFPEYWGRGLATEACQACLEFGFTTLKLHQIIGLVMPENTASIRVLEKSGMQFDGADVDDEIPVWRYVKRSQTPTLQNRL